MEPRPFTRQILLFILLEGLYIWLTRLLIGMGDPNGYTVESWRTLLRLVSAGLMAWVFRDLIKEFLKERVPSVTPPVSYLLPAIALFLAMLVPIAAGNWNLPTEGQRWFFAVTAFPVGLREEIVYRAILLVLLARAFGLSIAVVLSTLAFAVYHYGAQPWTVFTVTQYIFFGLALALLYWRSRSLWLIIWIHTIYDVLWCFSPFLENPLPTQETTPIWFVSTLLVLAWITCWKSPSQTV